MSVHHRALLIVNSYKKEASFIAEEISRFLSGKGYVCDVYSYDERSTTISNDSVDFVITLGGDGTVLFAARYCAPRHIPVFPINLGEFGFIAGIEPDAWKYLLVEFLEGKQYLNERMMLDVHVIRNNETVFSRNALNDAVISGSGMARMVRLAVSFNGSSFGTYKADGVIVATPTGSTAYSAASGGPIIAPDMSAMVLSPVSAFSLSNRPIVLPSSGIMKIRILPMRHKECILTIDGQEYFSLDVDDRVVVTEAPFKVHLVGCDINLFYTALRLKLNWAGAPVPVSLREPVPEDGDA